LLSERLRTLLEAEVVGQPRAVETLVRALTVAFSGVANPLRPVGTYLFVGPSGTGKTHLARSVAKVLHGDPRRLVAFDLVRFSGANEWEALLQDLSPHFRQRIAVHDPSIYSLGAASVLLFEHLDRAKPELVQTLLTALESGQIPLPDNRLGSLTGCLILLTSNLCDREILDAGRAEIGFSPRGETDRGVGARIFDTVSAAIDKRWGAHFLGHLDDLLVFHPLSPSHLPPILRLFERQLNERLAERRVTLEMTDEAIGYLVDRSFRELRSGAWPTLRAFRRFVLFPVADLLEAGKAGSGSRIVVLDPGDGGLRFEVRDLVREPIAERMPGPCLPVNVPIHWVDPTTPGTPDTHRPTVSATLEGPADPAR
jgi:ATP-dependent Clp protease ATP-binding subunit ClpC